MASKTHRYTVRGVSPKVDEALRKKAEAGLGAQQRQYHDLDFVIGTSVYDPAVDAALAEQRVVDPREWQ